MTSKCGKTLQKACLAWGAEGQSFVIRHGDELERKIIPMISCPAKFSSFLRKLYRWGFRQVVDRSNERSDKSSKNREKVFMHPYFQRDNKALMDRMKSITAEGTRKELATQSFVQHQESRLPKVLGNSASPEATMSGQGFSNLQSSGILHPYLQDVLSTQPVPQQRHYPFTASMMAQGSQRDLSARLLSKALDMDVLCPTPSSYLMSSSSLGALGSATNSAVNLHGLTDRLVRDMRLRAAAAADNLLLRNTLAMHQRSAVPTLFTRPSLSVYLPPLSSVFTTTELGRLEMLDNLVGGDFSGR